MTARQDRVERLQRARAKDSVAKRARAIETARRMHDSGARVTFAGVAREAAVSTWLVYNAPEVREAIQTLVDQQQAEGVPDAALPARLASPESLRTDLLLARDEVKRLRAENEKYLRRLRSVLGAEAEAASTPELLARVRELEAVSVDQHQRLILQDAELDTLRQLVDQLRDELEGKGEALRRMIHAQNS